MRGAIGPAAHRPANAAPAQRLNDHHATPRLSGIERAVGDHAAVRHIPTDRPRSASALDALGDQTCRPLIAPRRLSRQRACRSVQLFVGAAADAHQGA